MTKALLSPSPELSYVIGVVLGDGQIEKSEKKGNYRIELRNTKREFVEKFNRTTCKLLGKNRLYSISQISGYTILSGKQYLNKRWRVVAYSKELCKFLEGKILARFQGIIEVYPQDFLAGFYESEGSLAKNKHSPKYRGIRFYNTDTRYLKLATQAAELLGFKVSTSKPIFRNKEAREKGRKTVGMIQILGGSQAATRFLSMVNPVIKNEGANS